MTMFAVLNVETGDFYSESPALRNEAKRTGRRWDHTSILPAFARRFNRYRDALRRSQKVSDRLHVRCGSPGLIRHTDRTPPNEFQTPSLGGT